MRFILGAPWDASLLGQKVESGISPISTFEVELRHGGRSKRVSAGFDSGMVGAALEIPSSLARSLGLEAVSTEILKDPSGRHTISVGRLEELGIPGRSDCVVQNAKTWFFEGAPILVGDFFMREIGAIVSYGKVPTLECSGPSSGRAPGPLMFPVTISNRGRTIEVDAFFDTAWESSDLVVPPRLAQEIGLEATERESAPSPTGSYSAPVGRVDLLALADVPACAVSGARTKVLDFLGRVIVGEAFFKKTGSSVGYDQTGPVFRCGEAGGS
jgi:hypothetical protein